MASCSEFTGHETTETVTGLSEKEKDPCADADSIARLACGVSGKSIELRQSRALKSIGPAAFLAVT